MRKVWRIVVIALLAVVIVMSGTLMAKAAANEGAASRVLMSDKLTGNYYNPTEGNYAPGLVLGSEIRRDHVLSVTFTDSLSGAPEDAWDVSAARDGSVLAWTTPAGAPEEVLAYAYSSMEAGYVPRPAAPEGDYYDLTVGSEGGVAASADCSNLFMAYLNVRSIHTNGYLDTSNVTDMSGMFRDARSLAEVDLSGFDTSGVEDMHSMFDGCASLAELDLRGFDTSNVTDFSRMFFSCVNLMTLDVSGFNTAKAESMELMFAMCGDLESLDLRGFDTAEVTNMSHMFWSCGSLTELDLTSFDTAKAEKMERMFTLAEGLERILVSERFVIPEGTDMQAMFYGCAADGLTM